MGKKKTKKDVLDELIEAATPEALGELIREVASGDAGARAMCIDRLSSHENVSKALEERSAGEVALALWDELWPDLSELDSYGEYDHELGDNVYELLMELEEHVSSEPVPSQYRRAILKKVLPYIEDNTSVLADSLYDVAYGACRDEADLRWFAEALEGCGGRWEVDHARRIYRQIGDRDKYLQLRQSRLKYGMEYYDLATFYWEDGEKEKALEIAEKGLKTGEGRMDELRDFVAERALESGDREKYLAVQFAQATDGLTLASYKAFREICSREEWGAYEPQILVLMAEGRGVEILKVRMHRKEYDKAIVMLSGWRYPWSDWGSGDEIEIAKELETHYPEEVLTYYQSGFGNLNMNATRKEYARKAAIMAKVRRVLVDVMDNHSRWKTFAQKVKEDNRKRPAFQEEFGKAVPGWRELNVPVTAAAFVGKGSGKAKEQGLFGEEGSSA